MTTRSFADMAYQSLTFDTNDIADNLVLKLLDTVWVQRLRDISQTANTKLVYMFSEHSRFGHSLGAAYLAIELCNKLARDFPFVKEYKQAIAAAALLHDLGHIAPGSHAAQKTWFPDQPDQHENGSVKIIKGDKELSNILGSQLDLVIKILEESEQIPEWTWQIISGSGWNVDRGNWCIIDSILAGVNYGKYNIPALTDSLTIVNNKLALKENRLDAMVHFSISRYAMYKQIYQHRVLLSADELVSALVKRLRENIGTSEFADYTMETVLNSKSYLDLEIADIFQMREFWWRYHLMKWTESNDVIIADLSSRIINRRLFKTIRIKDLNDPLINSVKETAIGLGFNPDYYVKTIKTSNVNSNEITKSMPLLLDNGEISTISDSEPLISNLSNSNPSYWIAVPEEIKSKIGITR